MVCAVGFGVCAVELVGRCWVLMVCEWGHLGPILEHLEAMLGHLGALLAHLGAIFAHLGPMLGPSWADVGASWGYVGASWGYVGRSCAMFVPKHVECHRAKKTL